MYMEQILDLEYMLLKLKPNKCQWKNQLILSLLYIGYTYKDKVKKLEKMIKLFNFC